MVSTVVGGQKGGGRGSFINKVAKIAILNKLFQENVKNM